MNALTVTPKDYATAVQKLMDLAADHLGGSSEAAAQVLLSAYNGHEFKLDVTDLCSLDQGNRVAAYTVMEGRCGALNPTALFQTGQSNSMPCGKTTHT